jgi:hypothetical protein
MITVLGLGNLVGVSILFAEVKAFGPSTNKALSRIGKTPSCPKASVLP